MISDANPTAYNAPIAYTVENAAVAAGVARSALYEAMRDGKLRSVKKGKRRLIFRDDLISWLNTPDERPAASAGVQRKKP
jgi:excisionase family DNA binding protein